MYLLYTTPGCPNCPRAKEILNAQALGDQLEIIDASTAEGLERAQGHDVYQVPTLVETGPDGEPLHCHAGLSAVAAAFSP